MAHCRSCVSAGNPILPAIATRKQLFRKLGASIPKLLSRKARVKDMEKRQSEHKLQLEAKVEKAASTGNNKKKKKGKKKR